jgi:hypothetical protein
MKKSNKETKTKIKNRKKQNNGKETESRKKTQKNREKRKPNWAAHVWDSLGERYKRSQ